MSILVTGASGMIGSALVRQAITQGISVVPTARSNCDNLTRHFGVPVLQADLRNSIPSVSAAVDCIIHCATANDQVSKDFVPSCELTLFGTKRLLDFASKNGIKNFIFVSTLQVYGSELVGLVDESTPVMCESLYALNHRMGEELCELFARQHGMNVVFARPSNVFGLPCAPTVNRTNLVPFCFITSAIELGRIYLRTSGAQHRNFVSARQLCRQLLDVAESFPEGTTVMNCGSRWCPTILEIAELTAQIYRTMRSIDLPIDRSLIDSVSSQFELRSRWDERWEPAEETRAEMISTIRSLFDCCANRGALDESN